MFGSRASLICIGFAFISAACSGPTLEQFIKRDQTPSPTLEVDLSNQGTDLDENNEAKAPSVLSDGLASAGTAKSVNQSAEQDSGDATMLVATSTPIALARQEGAIPATSTPVNTPVPQRIVVATRAQRPTANPAPIGAAMAKINISSLALRRFPRDDAPTVGAVREGSEYSVSALSRDGKWVRLEAPIEVGGRGWVAARFVSVFGEITGILITDGLELGYNNIALAANQAVANTGERRLRIRSGPGSSFDTVFFAFNGELFTVLEESGNGDWVHLYNPSMNVDGWAARRFLRLASDPIPTARPSPTSTPTVLLSPPTARPTVLRPTATTILGQSTPRSTPRTPAAADRAPTDEEVIIITDGARLRVRSEPTTDSEIVARVLNNERYVVIERSDDGAWTRINLEDGNSGWVATRFTRAVEEAAP